MTVDNSTKPNVFKKGPLNSSKAGPLTTLLVENLHDRSPYRRARFYAKTAGLCYRQGAYKAIAPLDRIATFPASAHLYAGMGTKVHELVDEAFEKSGLQLKAELYAPDVGLNIGGYIDSVLMVDGEPRVIDVKTCGALPTKPKADHRAQVLVYTILTGIRNPILFYISRNVASWQGVLNTAELECIHSDDELFRTAISMAVPLYAVEEGVLPPKPPWMKYKSHCGFCEHKSKCFEGAAFHESIKHPSDEQWMAIYEKAHAHATYLIETMPERKASVLRACAKGGLKEDGFDWVNTFTL